MAKGWSTSFEKKLNRFFSRIDMNGSCWTWKGFINKGGYGRYKWSDRKNWLAHRLMYKLTFGDFDETLEVCHTCDNAKCVQPAHLFLRTHADNMHDMFNKGRGNQEKVRGELNKNSKLTEEIVREARKLGKQGLTQETLGKKFGVAHTTIGRILRGSTWKHVLKTKERG